MIDIIIGLYVGYLYETRISEDMWLACSCEILMASTVVPETTWPQIKQLI